MFKILFRQKAIDDLNDIWDYTLNRGIRGPYLTGSLYCGFIFEEEYEFYILR